MTETPESQESICEAELCYNWHDRRAAWRNSDIKVKPQTNCHAMPPCIQGNQLCHHRVTALWLRKASHSLQGARGNRIAVIKCDRRWARGLHSFHQGESSAQLPRGLSFIVVFDMRTSRTACVKDRGNRSSIYCTLQIHNVHYGTHGQQLCPSGKHP